MRLFSKSFDEKKERPPIDDIVEVLFDDLKNPTQSLHERVWFRNILYYAGEQYLDFVINLRTFRRKLLNPFIPTPVTNIIRDYVRSMRALILNRTVITRVWPDSMHSNDVQGAKLAEKWLRHRDMEDDGRLEDEKELVVLMMLLCGTAYMRTFPDMNAGQFFMDGKGNRQATGKVASRAMLPFNVRMDQMGGMMLKDKRVIGIKSIKPIEWVEDTFKKKVSGTDKELGRLSFEKRLTKLVAEVSPWKGTAVHGESYSDMGDEDLCLFKELEFAPTAKWPKGRYVVHVGDQTLIDVDELPIPATDDEWSYSLVDFHYHRMPGRFYSDPGVNDQISPQNSINSIDQALEMNRKGMGRPAVITPKSLALKKLNRYGSSFIALEYDPLTAGGQTPQIVQGTPLPDQVLAERMNHREAAQDAAGDPKNVLRGSSPGANASGYLIDVLASRVEAAHSPDIMRFYRAFKRVRRNELVLAQKLYTEKRLLKVGSGRNVEVISFKGADFRGNTDVRLEIGSGVTATMDGQTNMLMRLIETGRDFIFPNIAGDPQAQNTILRRLGLTSFSTPTSDDVERAQYENAQVATAKNLDELTIMLVEPDPETGEIAPDSDVTVHDPLFKYDDHQIHYQCHRRFIISDEFKTLSAEAQTLIIHHADIHKMLVDAQQAAAMQAAMQAEQAKNTGTSINMTVPPGGTEGPPPGGGVAAADEGTAII